MAEVGFEPPTSRFGVRRSITEPPAKRVNLINSSVIVKVIHINEDQVSDFGLKW